MPARRAVFTGLGLLTPIGSTPEAFWASLCAGTSGIRRIQRFDPSALRCPVAGEIPDFDPKAIITAAMKDTRHGNEYTRPIAQAGFANPDVTYAAEKAGLGKIIRRR